MQTIKDEMPVKAEILNSVGMNVYKGNLLFNAGIDKLQMLNTIPGLYLLRLTDNKGQKYLIKFVVE